MSDGLQYERYVWFEARIKEGKYPNSRHLAEEFEISGRTAQRTIEFMRERFSAPLAFNRDKNGYFYTDDAYELPGHWISETNVLSLALAVRLASTIPDPALKDDLCRLIERVTGAQGRRGKSCLQHLPEKISVKNIEYAEVDIAIFRQIVEALFGDRAISITYHSPHSKTLSTRTIRLGRSPQGHRLKLEDYQDRPDFRRFSLSPGEEANERGLSCNENLSFLSSNINTTHLDPSLQSLSLRLRKELRRGEQYSRIMRCLGEGKGGFSP